ncbi:MAG: hypothetical protein K0V04_29420 [Deltaproteobacteria bacterium]|nr:hypothetical protein [Deltaproteobacteria bacterium]
MVERRPRLTTGPWLAALVGLVALAVLLPGLGEHGVWTDAELPVFDRVRAALGASLNDLVRSPWLPDLARTRAFDALQDTAGLRLPHALAAAALAAMTTGLARARGASPGLSLLAGTVALAFPMLTSAGRTALGNPVGELLAAATVVAGLAALGSSRLAKTAVWAVVAAGLLVLSVASLGLALGGALPLGVLAAAATLGTPGRRSTITALALGAAAVTSLGIAVHLSLEQGDGYIPLLGAAKDQLLIDKPEQRRFAASLEDFGFSLFPWGPLVIAGALVGRRDRLPALWLGLTVTVAAGWSLVYGAVALPLTVPAALAAMASVEWALDANTERRGRRAALTVVALGMLVIGKDAERTPSRMTIPIHTFAGEHTFPAERLEAPERLGKVGSAALWALLAMGLLAPAGGRPHRLDRWLDRIPAGPRTAAPLLLIGGAAVYGSVVYAQGLVPQTCDLLSPRRLLAHHRALVEAGELPASIGNHRVRDSGLAVEGAGDVVLVGSRRELISYLSAEQPRSAIIRSRDLPTLHQSHRQNGWPLFVLDDHHATLRLVANRLPSGETDLNEIPTVLFDEVPPLANPTTLHFENYIEIVGWEITEPVVRGREATLRLAIVVRRPLPGGSKVYTRLLKGRTSLINGDPHELTGGIYPPNLWREGDMILDEFTFEAPLLEIQPGPHELIVGLRRSEKQNFEISKPEGKKGEHGVKVRGTRRSFASIGTVEVW